MAPILAPAMTLKDATLLLTTVRKHFHDIYIASQNYGDVDGDDEGELLCDVEFSLAYGGISLNCSN